MQANFLTLTCHLQKRVSETLDSPSEGYVKPQVDQVEEGFKEKPIPYISHDKFSQGYIFHYCHELLSGHTKNRPDTLKEYTKDKTLENTMKIGINTKLPSCDDKGVHTQDDDIYSHKTYMSDGVMKD